MSLSSIQSHIKRIQGEIQRLQQKLANEASKRAQKSSRIAQISRRITSSTSLSTIKSKQREVQRLEEDIVRAQKTEADLSSQVARKTKQLHRHQQDFYKEQEREQNKMMAAFESQQREQLRAADQSIRAAFSSVPFDSELDTSTGPKYDAFISHASEDKEDFVRPLAEALKGEGLDIWYDEFQLKVGDSLRRSIDKGLANSRFGIVILSPDFFLKNWTQYELDGLVSKEMIDGKVILPIWHKVSKDEVIKYSPTLADKVALSTAAFSANELASKLAEAIKKS